MKLGAAETFEKFYGESVGRPQELDQVSEFLLVGGQVLDGLGRTAVGVGEELRDLIVNSGVFASVQRHLDTFEQPLVEQTVMKELRNRFGLADKNNIAVYDAFTDLAGDEVEDRQEAKAQARTTHELTHQAIEAEMRILQSVILACLTEVNDEIQQHEATLQRAVAVTVAHTEVKSLVEETRSPIDFTIENLKKERAGLLTFLSQVGRLFAGVSQEVDRVVTPVMWQNVGPTDIRQTLAA